MMRDKPPCARLALLAGLAGLAVLLSSESAQAVPAFARKHSVGCSTCHVAFPLLNMTGRRFREAGYRFADRDGRVDDSIQNDRTIAPGLTVDPSFPVSAVARGWAFESTNEDHTRIRPVSAASLLVAGLWANNGSAFLEAAADDEGNWTPDVGAQIGYHPSRFLSLMAGSKGPFHPDPYNTFRDSITFNGKSGVDRIADDDVGRPTLEAWGRARALYYAGALAVTSDNTLGVQPRMGFGRVAVDLSDRNMIGAFIYGGRRIATATEPERTVLRTGIDLNLAWRNLYIIALAAMLREQVTGGHDVDITGFLELFYTIPVGVERLLIPLVRPQFDTFGDRAQSEVSLVGGAYFQFVQNARIGVEGSGDLKPQVSGERKWSAGANLIVAL